MESTGVVDSIKDSFEDMLDQIINFGPKILGAVFVVFVGVIVAKVITKIIRKVVEYIETQKTVKEFLEIIGMKQGVSALIAKFTYWIVFIVFLSAAADVLELAVLSETIDSLIAFTPKLLSAALIAGVSYLGSRVLRDLVESSLAHADKKLVRPAGLTTQVVVMTFGITTALAQLGLNLDLISDNITVVVAGLALSFGLAVGLGGRKIAGSYITGVLAKDTVKVGQTISVDGMKGKVKAVNSLSITLDTKDGDVVVSHGRLMR